MKGPAERERGGGEDRRRDSNRRWAEPRAAYKPPGGEGQERDVESHLWPGKATPANAPRSTPLLPASFEAVYRDSGTTPIPTLVEQIPFVSCALATNGVRVPRNWSCEPIISMSDQSWGKAVGEGSGRAQ